MFNLKICQIVYPSISGCKQQFNIDYKAYFFQMHDGRSDVITFLLW